MSYPAYAWNGNCDKCFEDIYGPRFDSGNKEYHPECAADLGLCCYTCHLDECRCPEVLAEIAAEELVELKEAA